MVKCDAEMGAPSQILHGLEEQYPSACQWGYLFSTWQGGMEEKNPQTDPKSPGHALPPPIWV